MWDFVFDFPTFNPDWKTNPAFRAWYATAPKDEKSLWMDTVLKGDARDREIKAIWHQDGFYTTEANFIPRPGAADEEDGVLFSVLDDSKEDVSVAAVFDPKTLKMIGSANLGLVIPYHSHGALCTPERCSSNP